LGGSAWDHVSVPSLDGKLNGKIPPALTTAKKFEYEDVAFRKVQKENEATSIWWLTSEYEKGY